MAQTKLDLSDNKFEQLPIETLHLSGCTHVYGQFQMECGSTLKILPNHATGKILTSDSSGVATWNNPSVGNGLSLSGTTIVLGGTLTCVNTIIDVNKHSLYFYSCGNTNRGISLNNSVQEARISWADTGTTCCGLSYFRPDCVNIESSYPGGGCRAEITLVHADNRICFKSESTYQTYHNACGLWYTDDFSSTASPRWVPDKAYVDGKITGDTQIGDERITKIICQISHGFNINDVIGFSGGTYNKPIANGLYNGEILGIVSKCYNADCFDLTQAGYVTGLTGLITDETYFLSPITAGLLTNIAPTGDTQISKGVLIATSTNTAWVLPYPGYVVTTGNTTGIGFACNGLTTDGTTVCLGGTLIGDTCVITNGHTLSFQDIGANNFMCISPNQFASYTCCGGIIGFINILPAFNSLNLGISNFGVDNDNIYMCSTCYEVQICTVVGSTASIKIDCGTTTFCQSCQLLVNSGNPSFAGAEYVQDYSANYTNRSLVDMGYVLSVISGETGGGDITGATNGLYKTGKNIALGGTLTGNTTINLNSNSLSITGGTGFGVQLTPTIALLGNINSGTWTCLNEGTIIDAHIEIAGIGYSEFILLPTDWHIYVNNNINTTCIDGITNNITISSDDPVFSGLQYGSDYSANYTCLSIPNAGWVTGHTGGGTITGGTNGLSTSGANIVLGGKLTGNTTLDVNCHSFTVCGAIGVCMIKITEPNGGDSCITLDSCTCTSVCGGCDVKIHAGKNLTVESVGLGNTTVVSGYDTYICGTNTLSMCGCQMCIYDNDATPVGIQYADDYSANYTNRSLVDKGYVNAQISGGSSLSTFTITGNSSATGFTVNHAKNKQFVGVEIVRGSSPYDTVYTSIQRPNTNCICITFDVAPTTGQEFKILITS